MHEPIFKVLSERTAHVTTYSKGAIALVTDPRTQVHHINVLGAPRYRLDQPLAPDDGWSISPVMEADARVPTIVWNGEVACRNWLNQSDATDVSSEIGALSPGEYLILRSRRQPHTTPFVYFGNQRILTPSYARTIRDERPFYSYLIDASPDGRAASIRHAVGVAVLNYFGNSRAHGVLFFSDLDSAGPPVSSEPVQEILVLPLRGSLVVDNLSAFSVEEEGASRQRWADGQAWEFAAWLVEDDRLRRG